MSNNTIVASEGDVPRFSLRTLLVIVLIASVILGVFAYLRDRAAWHQAERERLAKLDKATTEQIVVDVEAIRARLGRAPNDERELEALLGHLMPAIHASGREYPISYRRVSENRFQLD